MAAEIALKKKLKKYTRNLETPVREANVELERAYQFRENIIENSPDAIVCIRKGGEITIFNSAAEKLLGYKKHQVIGKMKALASVIVALIGLLALAAALTQAASPFDPVPYETLPPDVKIETVVANATQVVAKLLAADTFHFFFSSRHSMRGGGGSGAGISPIPRHATGRY